MTLEAAALKFGLGAGLLIAAWAGGCTHAQHKAEVRLAELHGAAKQADQRYRQLETEAANAQTGYVEAWTRQRDSSAADWVRLEAAARRRRVPAVCAEPSGAEAGAGAGLEVDRPTDIEVVKALAAAEELGATLRLCQTELRTCAALR